MATILNNDTVWRRGEVVNLTTDVQIAPGATLTIEQGATVIGNGFALQVFGALKASGSENELVHFDNVRFLFGSDHQTNGRIELSFSELSGGAFLPATGNASYGASSLTDSVLHNVSGFYVWYPTSNSFFERNQFVNSDGLSIGSAEGIKVYVTNNAFLNTVGPAVETWASYGGVNTIVSGNSFLDVGSLTLSIPNGYTSSSMLAENNFFATTDPAIIETMIHDRNDSLNSASVIDYAPYLVSPHPLTPSLSDQTAPAVVAVFPADGATAVPVNTDFVLTFTEDVEAGSGSFVLKAGATTIGSINVSDAAQVSISGNQVIINPHYVLSPGVSYTVVSPAGVVKDLSGNDWAGMATYDFTTVAQAPNYVSVNGGPFVDIVVASSANERINGGEGLDTVVFSGAISQYQINAQTGVVTDGQSGRDGYDVLSNVERLMFTDLNLALDTAKGEIAGSAYRLYKAAFDRTPDAEGLGFWIASLDSGASLASAAQGFINSAEFKAMYGENATDEHFVTLLYNHVLHRAPEGAGYQFWLDSLDVGASRAQVLKDFSESTENINQTASLIANGIQYEAW
ncbi:DUF4214 domain-containing protein, partial [Flavobacterium sp.]|uniref:DUF4214 domain-containing protein n=1 Tax=Flavobacterium sp. TaxID=239 RepID=UPI0037C13977